MKYHYFILSALLLLVFCAWSALPAAAAADTSEPYEIALGPDGNVYTFLSGNASTADQIYVFAPDGRQVRTITAHASAFAFDDAGNLFVGDFQNAMILKMDANGTILKAWNYETNSSIAVLCLAVSPDGKVYLRELDTGNAAEPDLFFRIYENGTQQLVRYRNITSGAGDFAVGADGTIYAIATTNSIDIISLDGNVTTFGHASGDDDGFNAITGIALGKDGYLYVTEYGNHRVKKLTANGTFVTMWKGAGWDAFLYPQGIAATADGKVYVADPHNQRIVWLTTGYTFGNNTTDNLKGEGATWGYVYQGTNYTTKLHELNGDSTATPTTTTPGFSTIITLMCLAMAGVVLCLRPGKRS